MAKDRSKNFAKNFRDSNFRKKDFLEPELSTLMTKSVSLIGEMNLMLDEYESMLDEEDDQDFIGAVGELEMKIGSLALRAEKLRAAAKDLRRVFREAEEVSKRVAEALANG